MEYLYMGIVVVAFILLIFILVPYLQKKNIITPEGMKVVVSIVEQVKILINNASFKNSELKDTSLMIFNIAEVATRSVESAMKFEDNELKKNVAIAGIEETLKELGLPTDDNQKNLIDIAVSEGVKLLPKTYKKIQ